MTKGTDGKEKPLDKMTVKELREIALEIPDLKGVHGMNKQDLLDAAANLISAEADVQIAAYGVLSTMGELTAKDLRLNVQTYDPKAYYNLVKDAPTESSKQGQQLDRVLRALGKD